MSISLPDARELSDAVLEALRLRALHGIERGYSETEMAALLGLARETVSRWWCAYQRGGVEELPHDRTGRPVGTGRLLSEEQAKTVQTKIEGHTPSDYHIAAPLWTRQAVRDLIRQVVDVDVPIRTVGAYLKRWGYTCKRPRRKARQQDPEEVKTWLQDTYPGIAKRARQEGGDILWCDEKGVQANEHTGGGYALVGQTPVIEVSSHPARMNVVSTVTATGQVHFMTYAQTMTATVFVTFLEQLLRTAEKKIFLIGDRLPAHQAAAVKDWLKGKEARIEWFPLPAHAPELNPDEYLNNDLHHEVNARTLPTNQQELRSNLQSFLHKLAKLPQRIISYFHNPFIQYAAETV